MSVTSTGCLFSLNTSKPFCCPRTQTQLLAQFDVICITVLELFSFFLLTQETPQRFSGPTSSRVPRLHTDQRTRIHPLQQLLLMCILAEMCSVWSPDLWGFHCDHCRGGFSPWMGLLPQPGVPHFLRECSASCSPSGFASLLVYHQCQFAQPSMREEEMQFSRQPQPCN